MWDSEFYRLNWYQDTQSCWWWGWTAAQSQLFRWYSVRRSFLSLGSSRPCVLPIHRPSPLGFPFILRDWPVDTLSLRMLEVCFWWEEVGINCWSPEMEQCAFPFEPVSLYRWCLSSILLLLNICSISLFTYFLVTPVGRELAIAGKHILPPTPHTHLDPLDNHSAVIPRTFVHHAIHFISISTVHLYK